MKQGQWAAEWKKKQKTYESIVQKAGGGKDVEKKCTTAMKNVEKALQQCDSAFKEFAKGEQENQPDIVKQLSQAQDDYNAACNALKSEIDKAGKKNKSADAKKTAKEFDNTGSEMSKNIGTALIGMDMIVKHRKRQERKAENITKDLKKTCKGVKAFIAKATADKTGEFYKKNIVVVGNDLSDLLTDLDKFIRKNDKIDNKKAPPKSLISDSLPFSDMDTMDCEDGEGNFDVTEMKGILKEMTSFVKEVEKWQGKTWTK